MSDGIGTLDGKASVQERILRAAEEAFANNSFPGTRISEIAVKAGVNQALIHYYFESKEKLYQEVLARLFRQWETFVGELNWEGKDAPAFIREYIKAHFELKCRMPNLYKIFHWETLEGGEMFGKYASSTWTQDFLDIARKLEGWKAAGMLRPEIDANVLLYLLFGMMNQFYFRKRDELAAVLESEGELEELQAEIAERMVDLTLHGVLPQAGSGTTAKLREREGVRMTALLASSDLDAGKQDEEALRILERLRALPDADLRIERPPTGRAALQEAGSVILVFVCTSFGEMPEWVRDWLRELEDDPSPVDGKHVAVWTNRDSPASEGLQRLLEDAFNRAGAYAVARIPGQSPDDYVRRCARLAGARPT